MNNLYLKLIILVFSIQSNAYSSILNVDSRGIYGGFWRDLYKLGPFVIDTIGADLGVFAAENFKMGFSFATEVGILSSDPDHDIFDAFQKNPKGYNEVLNPLVPADFSYSTAALKLEYIFYNGDVFAWSTTTNLGVGVIAFTPPDGEERGESFTHNYASQGIALITKVTNNLRVSIGVSYRKDLDANSSDRRKDYENFDAVTIYNHFYLVKF